MDKVEVTINDGLDKSIHPTKMSKLTLDTEVAKQMMLNFIQNDLMKDSLTTMLEVAAKNFPDTFWKVHEAKQFEFDMFSDMFQLSDENL